MMAVTQIFAKMRLPSQRMLLTLFVSPLTVNTRMASVLVMRGASSCMSMRRGVIYSTSNKSTSEYCKVDSASSVLSAQSTLAKHRWFSTTSRDGESETDRVTQAYLRDSALNSIQKHDGNRLIYEVRGQSMLRVVSIVFYATAVVGLYVTPDFVVSAMENEAFNQETVTNFVAVSLAVVGLPLLLRMLSNRLILKLYHNEARETYVAITQSFYLTNKMTKFSLSDVVVTEKKGVLGAMFNLTSFKAKKHPFHVNAYNFKLPSDYNHLLGYDKM